MRGGGLGRLPEGEGRLIPHHRSSRRAARAAGHVPAAGPVFEPLDPRRLLSASVQQGVLHVDGTAGNDVIAVLRDPGNAQQILVKVNGVVQTFDAAGITGASVYAALGNDRVSLEGFDLPS